MAQFFKEIQLKILNNKKVIENFSYLAIIQVVNLVITIATYPYLIHVLGKEVFGLVVFAQAIVSYLVVLVSFGFNISATKEISVNRNNKKKVSQIFSSILILKGILFLISLGIISLCISFIPQANDYKLLFYFSMFACFYEFIYPSWYFQGVEKMKYIAIITLTSKFIFLILIFIFVKSRTDYLLVPLLNGIGSIIAGAVSIYIIILQEKVSFRFQPLKRLWAYFNESLAFFISNVSIQIYANANKVIIGSFLGMTEVAYYDLAEKVVLILKLPQAILTQTIFPKISKELNLNFIKKMFYYSTAGNIFLFLMSLLLAPIIVYILGNRIMGESANLLRLFALTIPINGISSFLSLQILVPFGYKKIYIKVITSSLVFYLGIILLLYVFGIITLYSLILTTILIEILTAIIVYQMCKKKNLLW
jgi:O-antigen/teichoic acid export membrane protein